MQKKLIELHLQRGRLIERIALQRSTLARQIAPVRVACDTTDRVLTAVRDSVNFIQRHPLEVAAFAAALFVMKPRRVWRWLQRGFFVWQGWGALRGRLARLRQ
ncbi:MAG: YqjK family protein [Thiobacillaceae bacterium]|jgi:hypothetical protein